MVNAKHKIAKLAIGLLFLMVYRRPNAIPNAMSNKKNKTPELNGSPNEFTKILSKNAAIAGVFGMITHCNKAIEPIPITDALMIFLLLTPNLFMK
jgi:hypothetical protein